MRSTLPTLFFVATFFCFAFGQNSAHDDVPSELAQRLAGPGSTVFVGELPPQDLLPFDLPLPAGTRVVGSSASDPENGVNDYRYATIYLDVPGTPDEAAAFYRRAFASPWQNQESYNVTGFLPAGAQSPNETLNFCRARTNVYLELTHSEAAVEVTTEAEETAVTAYINIAPEAEAASWCQQNTSSDWRQPPLPTLVAPENSTGNSPDVSTGGTSGLGSSSIALETELSGSGLFAHYAEQLLAADWEEVRSLGEGPLYSSSYRFETEGTSYLATLQVMQNGVPGRYLVQVSVFPR